MLLHKIIFTVFETDVPKSTDFFYSSAVVSLSKFWHLLWFGLSVGEKYTSLSVHKTIDSLIVRLKLSVTWLFPSRKHLQQISEIVLSVLLYQLLYLYIKLIFVM